MEQRIFIPVLRTGCDIAVIGTTPLFCNFHPRTTYGLQWGINKLKTGSKHRIFIPVLRTGCNSAPTSWTPEGGSFSSPYHVRVAAWFRDKLAWLMLIFIPVLRTGCNPPSSSPTLLSTNFHPRTTYGLRLLLPIVVLAQSNFHPRTAHGLRLQY